MLKYYFEIHIPFARSDQVNTEGARTARVRAATRHPIMLET